MHRRTFTSTSLAALLCSTELPYHALAQSRVRELQADVVIVGGGLGGCAAALAALRNDLSVIMAESTDWIGGQLTSQAVPPDEHRWIEQQGANETYRELRRRIRDYYRRFYPISPTAGNLERFNPGNGNVSRLCCQPRVALAVLRDWLAPYVASQRLTLLLGVSPEAVDVDGDQVKAVQVKANDTGTRYDLTGSYFVDATELGSLLPLSGTEFVMGAESREQTEELHAASVEDPMNQQAFTMCFATDYIPDENHTIDQPEDYQRWRTYVPQLSPPWPGRLLDFTYTHPRTGKAKRLAFDPLGGKSVDGTLNLWTYRRLIDRTLFSPGHFASDISLINWPQNDYFAEPIVGVNEGLVAKRVADAKQLSLSLLYWLQTEAPRPDGGSGFPGLRLRPDLVGTEDGLAKQPYIRESRRIRSLRTITERDVGLENRAVLTGESPEQVRATQFNDSVGVGYYPIDLHPTTAGDNYIDFESLPFQIPLRALVPIRVQNLLPACKNIGTTHVTNGCYRLHPVEWGIGEAVGCLIRFALSSKEIPQAIASSPRKTQDFQALLEKQGVQLAWDFGALK